MNSSGKTLVRYPQGRSQSFTFTRRNLLRGLASTALPLLISRPQRFTSFGHSKPDFSIGDRVRTSWEADGICRSETGQVVGICWHPTHKHWEYLVVWGSSSFDEGLTAADGLELNHYA